MKWSATNMVKCAVGDDEQIKWGFRSTPMTFEQVRRELGFKSNTLLEMIYIWVGDESVQMLIHEEGKLNNLPRNNLATTFYQASAVFDGRSFKNATEDFIVGPALLLAGSARCE